VLSSELILKHTAARSAAARACENSRVARETLHDEIHDHTHAHVLERVRDAMTPEARLVVVEMLIADDGPPTPAPLLDLNMLVMLTGKERTADDFGALFAKAGLLLSGVTPTHSPIAIVEARRA
jgi:hypothetical protein